MKQFFLYFGATVGFGVLAIAGIMLLWSEKAPAPNEVDDDPIATSEPLEESAPVSLPATTTRVSAISQTALVKSPHQKVKDLASIPLPVLSDVSGPPTRTLLHPAGDRYLTRWFPNNDRVLTVYRSDMRPSKISVTEVKTGKQLWAMQTQTVLRSAAVSADGSQVAVSEDGALVTVYDAATGNVMHKIPGPVDMAGSENVAALRFDETGKQIVTVHYDRTLLTWDIASKRETSRTLLLKPQTFPRAFSGEYVRAKNRARHEWWAVQNAAAKLIAEVDTSHRFAEMSTDGRLLAVVEGREIVIKNVSDGSVYKRLELPLLPAPSAAGQVALNVPPQTPRLFGGSFDSAGKRFAAFTYRSEILIWDVESGELLCHEEADRGPVRSEYSERLSPDGNYCLLPTDRGGFVTLNLESNEQLPLISGVPIVDWRTTQSTAFSHNGQFQAVTLVGGAIEVRDTQTNRVAWSTESLTEVTHTLTQGPEVSFTTSDISAFAVSNSGTFVVATTHSGEVFVAAEGSKAVMTKLAANLDVPLCVALSANDQHAVIATVGGGIVRLQAAAAVQNKTINAEVLATVEDASLRSSALAINAACTVLAVGRADGSIQLRSLTAFTGESTLQGGDGPVRRIAFSADGRQVACTTYAGTAFAWDISQPQMPKLTSRWPASAAHISRSKTIQFSPNQRPVCTCPLRFSQDGSRLFVGRLSSIDVFDTTTGEGVGKLDSGERVSQLALRMSDNRILATRIFGEVYEWEPTVKESLNVATGSKCRFVQFTPDGQTLIAGGEKGQLSFIDANSGEILHTGNTETGGALAGAISPGGTRLAVCGYATGVEVWDILARKSLGKYYGHQKRVHSVAFSPDGRLVASGSEDGTVRVRDVATKKQVQKFDGHKMPPTTLAFSRDGKRVLSGTKNWKVQDQNGILRIWDLDTGKQLKSITEPFGHIDGIGFSPFDKSITFAATGTMVTLQDIDSAKVKDQFNMSLGLSCPRYLLHGRLLAFKEFPDKIHVRDVVSGERVTTFTTNSQIFELTTTPDGSAIAAACEDGSVRVWKLGQ